MTLATGTLQDNLNTSVRETGTLHERAVAVVNPDGSEISAGGGGSSGDIDDSSINGAIIVGTSAVEAKIGATALLNRKFVCITPMDGILYWGSDASVTVLNGTPIQQMQSVSISFTDNVPVYLIATSSLDVRLVEGA